MAEVETQARKGWGTLLKLGDNASPQNFTEFAEVISINGFGFTPAELEATHLESPNAYAEFVSGIKTGDVLTVVLNMIRANAIQTKAVWDAGLRRDFELDCPGDLPNYDFSAIPLGWHIPSIAPNVVMTVEVTMRVSGAIGGE